MFKKYKVSIDEALKKSDQRKKKKENLPLSLNSIVDCKIRESVDEKGNLMSSIYSSKR